MIRVGLCGFTIGAAAYFETFPIVEVQQTFYEPPSRATLERWRAQAPSAFEFTIKAWQLITHRASSRTYRRLKTPLSEAQRAECGGFQWNETVRKAWLRSLECARLLRATVILFQCPASFRPEPQNVDAMRRFFAEARPPDGMVFAWEPRGAWPDDLVRELCSELGLVHAVDPFLREAVTDGKTYWRLHGIGSAYAAYTDAELSTLARKLSSRGEGIARVFFNNVPRPRDAQRFLGRIDAKAQ